MISAPQVALKCRPLTGREGGRDIVRVTNDKVSTFFQKFRFFVCVCVCGEVKVCICVTMLYVGGTCFGS